MFIVDIIKYNTFMGTNMKSDVENMWDKFKEQFGVKTEWNNLNPMEQNDIVIAINVLLNIINNNKG